MSGRVLVLKFGGTALSNPDRVRLAARRIRAQRVRGRSTVAVASAMDDRSDVLLKRIRRVAPEAGADTHPREADRALATGEEEASALLALALADVGLRAISLRGGEAGLRAEGPHGDATLVDVDEEAVLELLEEDVVPVVCGFQAARADGETVTLGRNSSDLTAVALAVALGGECHLVTDVDGIYGSDPRSGERGTPIARLSHDELVRMAEQGGGVVHPTAARLASAHGLPLSVYSFRHTWIGGTRVGTETSDETSGRDGR